MKIEIIPIDLDCGGGYCDGETIYCEEALSPEDKRLLVIHEVLHHHLKEFIGNDWIHSHLDVIAEDCLDSLSQID